jgi:hypothetical protein
VLAASAALAVSAAIWLGCLHFLYRPAAGEFRAPEAPSLRARGLAAHHLALWTDPDSRSAEIGRMRATCQEWDFMGRTFLVLGLADMALRDPGLESSCLQAIDAIVDETLHIEHERGFTFFLLPYGHDEASFIAKPPRSIFVDGEIALMMGARRLVREKPEYRGPMRERIEFMTSRMSGSPVLCAESYPDECWIFCNTAALAATRMSDILDGTDHSEFFRRWVATARRHLIEPRTGLLFSSFNLAGRPCDGPEGSSIWMAAHCLQLIDAEFARDQYARARQELGRSLLGFGYAREWPVSHVGPADVDSGAVVPVLGASPSASGLALMGAAAFDDGKFYGQLTASLNLAGFPSERGGRLRYCASNQVGDAVILYSTVLGPLWRKAGGPAEAEGARP